jgi:ABC-type dipeptide/oligopeptide/nickel transport system permease subunit
LAVSLALLTILALTAIFAGVIAPHDPLALDPANRFSPPSLTYLFGTDRYGRDLFSRLLYGARISLGLALVSITAATLLGGFFGLLSGFFRGGADLVLMRLMDLLVSFPPFLLAVTIAAALGPGASNAALAVTLIYIPIFARLTRSAVLIESQKDYVLAERSVGAGNWRVMFQHLVPNSTSPVIVQFTLAIAQAILLESALSYLGLGTQPPDASWGTALSDGRVFLVQAPWLSLFPALAIGGTTLLLFIAGDGIRDLQDPRTR